MANYIACACIFRLALPILLSTCVVFRPTILSALYFLFLLYLPLAPVPTQRSMTGHTGIYLKILITFSTLALLSQIAFQIVLFSLPPYGHILQSKEFLEVLLRHIGYVRLDNANAIAVLTWVSPEILFFVTSIVIYTVCKKLVLYNASDSLESKMSPTQKAKNKKRSHGILVAIGRYGVLLALCFAAVLRPSIPGGLYFLIFLSSATWWACYKELQKRFAILMRCLMVVVVLHMLALYAYQFPWPQEFLDKNSTYARYFGLTPILVTETDDPRNFVWAYDEWSTFLNPAALFLLYYILALESKALLKPQSKKKQGPFSRLEGSLNGPLSRQLSQRLSNKRLMRSATTKNKWQSATRKVRDNCLTLAQKIEETTPLIRGVSPSARKYGSGKRTAQVLQDSTGSVVVTDEIPLEQIGLTEEEYKPSLLENILIVSDAILQVIIKSSYIGTNIIMMTWSITYLSWITFVLLLWANLLWLVPNQRKSMLRSSPFLVLYAWFLLITAYIYSMNLTEDELPSIPGKIGFDKITELSCNQLLVKCLFTCMFWVTLRQYMQERLAEKQTNTLADMVAPLQITVGAAAGVENEQQQGSKIMDKIGKYLNKFLTKFWIWFVAIMLFAVAITGQKMTGFRIIYMTLFLIFVLTFQFSFRIWRRIMFGFWLTVIVYSMVVLVMVYTYQFDNAKNYWEEYLHVNVTYQLDIGLEQFETKQLFVRLVTPTVFVIIAVIQLHYFHKDFMELSDPKNASVVNAEIEGSSMQGGATNTPENDETLSENSVKLDLTDVGNISTAEVQKFLILWLRRIKRIINLIFLFLEVHMPKIVLFFAMLVCVFDECALYLIMMVLIVLALGFGRPLQYIAIYGCSMITSFLLIARMIYQIHYITPDKWNVTCRHHNYSTIENNAQWLGFYKTGERGSLPYLVRWNIIYILVVTIWAVVLVRQSNYKISRGRAPTRTFFMFPKITRNDADKNLINCFKYLLNYGFYKFGVEICLMTTVALIGFRMDMYAVLYSVWLCILYSLKRSTLSKIWNVYLIFIAVLLIFQYIMSIGLPPTLCIVFPWDDYFWFPNEASAVKIYRRWQDWCYILDTYNRPSPKKLICDFVLLLMVSRQSVVFRIEKRHENEEYNGGSNDSILHHAEEKDFINPVPDFITYVRSWLDVFKRAVLLSFLWFTLAIVFLAGTNRVNIFSIGYLVGAFVFLWQGTDLYLRPIPKILKSWNWLLGYNVSVILIKSLFQIIGCIYMKEMPKDSCWFIQLFAIGCVRKFGQALDDPMVEPNQCSVPREYIGLVWDGLCFGFLIMQRRIFQSYNFFHMVNEAKATTILASRGAELIEELRIKRMVEQEEQERQVLQKIKTKMDRIKATQQKMLGAAYKDPRSHYVDTIFKGRPKRPRTQPKTYRQAVRSGDYYMFDDIDDEELDLVEELDAGEEDDSTKTSKPTVGQLLSTAMKTDIGKTVRLQAETSLKRRLSMPLARQRSVISTRSQQSAPFSAPPTVEEREPKLVKIIEDQKKDEPQPSTSKDEDKEMSEISEIKEDSPCQKIMNYILFAWAFIESSMISLTNFLNRYSRDYRYILRVLAKEKKILKETTDYNVGLRLGSSQIWRPSDLYHNLLKKSREELKTSTPSDITLSPTDSYRLAVIEDRMTSASQSDNSNEKPPISEESDTKAVATPRLQELDRRKASVLTVPEIRILAPSLERGLDSPFHHSDGQSHMTGVPDYDDTEMSSYDQPTVIRLVLAIWYIVMSRSELLCYFIVFLNQIKSATFLSLPLPLMVFLWGTLTVPRPTKTFWVTIIAYTEVIVLIKCMFQFDMIPWNYEQNIINNPFSPPRIIGIERNKHYAVYDLLLLLVVFFHRFMLKSMGLWKSSVIPAVLLAEGDYKIDKNGELTPVVPKTKKSSKDDDKTNRSSPSRKSSDLQRLVEETEEPEDEDKTSRTSSELEDEVGEVEIDDKIVSLQKEPIDKRGQFPKALMTASSKYAESIKKFFKQLLDPTSRVAADVYSYMFLCDFFNFFVILVGYSAFGAQQGDEDVSSYLSENRVPVLFLLMLILQFMLIIIDRGIYLRKNIFAKAIFQFTQVILLHIWLFIMFPIITERSFNSVTPPQIYYMVKCFYLLLASYQIRCGYPTRILGNFVCKSYNYLNMLLFKGFMNIPFLYELRTIMDWMWTDTSMTVFDWLKMEDIFAHIFQLKCSRHVEDEYPQPRGEKKNPVVKYITGSFLLTFIIGVIWFPLVFFSIGNAVGESNLPFDVTLEVRIGPYEPIYQMSAQRNSIVQFSETDYNSLLHLYVKEKSALSFLSNYEAKDVAAVKLSINSGKIWNISPPDRERLLEELGRNDTSIDITLDYKVSHSTGKPEDAGTIHDSVDIVLPSKDDEKITSLARKHLLSMLQGNTSEPALLPQLLPKFLKVTNTGSAKSVAQLMDGNPDEGAKILRNVTIHLNQSTSSSNLTQWWDMKEDCNDFNYQKYLTKIMHNENCQSLVIYTFNDRKFPATFSFISGGGIFGLYTTFVFVAWRFLHGFFAEQCFKIMFDDLPNVDRVLQLCLDIYLVREAREFTLEEDLFAKLVFLFRSPETLIKWTRPKEEVEDEDNPEGDED